MQDDGAVSAIAARNRGFERLYAEGDARALVEHYFVADEAGPMASPPGGRPPARGRPALIALFGTMVAEGGSIGLETLDLKIQGRSAYEFGRAKLTSSSGDHAFGRYVVIWNFDGSEWRAKLDFFAGDGWLD